MLSFIFIHVLSFTFIFLHPQNNLHFHYILCDNFSGKSSMKKPYMDPVNCIENFLLLMFSEGKKSWLCAHYNNYLTLQKTPLFRMHQNLAQWFHIYKILFSIMCSIISWIVKNLLIPQCTNVFHLIHLWLFCYKWFVRSS